MTQWGLDNLFNPGKRHMDDEKRRLQSTREEIGDSSGGRRIDLEAGKVSISVRRPNDGADDDQGATAEAAIGAAIEAEDFPTVALANDEAEIEPGVVDDDPAGQVRPSRVESVATVDAVPPESPDPDVPYAAPHPDPEVAADVPINAPVSAAPRRRQLSANAWSRRG